MIGSLNLLSMLQWQPLLMYWKPCRVRDDCITVAVEDMPDEGLDQPLRLDKLANEVTCQASVTCSHHPVKPSNEIEFIILIPFWLALKHSHALTMFVKGS